MKLEDLEAAVVRMTILKKLSKRLQLMNTEEYKGKIMIILADTDDNIDSLFDANAAFSSRFSKRIRFNLWDSKQAAAVCETLSVDSIDLDDGTLDALEEGCQRLMKRSSWANGRTVKDTLLILVKKKRALRRNRAAKMMKEAAVAGPDLSTVSSKMLMIDDVTAALVELIPKSTSHSKHSHQLAHYVQQRPRQENNISLWSKYLAPEVQSLRSTATITCIDTKTQSTHAHVHSDTHDEDSHENVDEFESFNDPSRYGTESMTWKTLKLTTSMQFKKWVFAWLAILGTLYQVMVTFAKEGHT